jgi:2'-5' RNA ligase
MATNNIKHFNSNINDLYMCGFERKEFVRAFIAIELPDEIRQRIVVLEDEIAKTGADVKLVEYENLHVTMKFLGDISTESIDRVHETIRGIKASKYRLRAKGTGVFPNSRMIRVLWVGIAEGAEETVSIFRQLEKGLAQMGFPQERDFTPHITIGRVRSPRNREVLINAMDRNRDTEFGITKVDSLVMKKSILTATGAVYSNLREAELEP